MADLTEDIGSAADYPEAEPVDVMSVLPDVVRAVHALQQRGVQLVPPPTQLPPLNVGALLRMNPVQAAMLVRARQDQAQRNLAQDRNTHELISQALNQTVEQKRFERGAAEKERLAAQSRNDKQQQFLKERDNAGSTFAEQWADVIQKNQEATAAKDQAAAALEQIMQFSKGQQLAGNVVAGIPTEKPNPREGIHAVPIRFTPKKDTSSGRPFPPGNVATREKVAEILNTEVANRTKAFNDAVELYLKRTKETHDLQQLTGGAYVLKPDRSALIDIITKKAFPLPTVSPAKRTGAFDPRTGTINWK